MELGKFILFKIKDMNCEFRTLHKMDVSQDYVNGLMEQKEYIENIPNHVSISSQTKYINDILYSKDDTICGLFINNELVGTAGIQSSTSFLQNIEVPAEYIATIGIFLFNKSYRGIGLGKTLVWAATYLFHNSNQTEWFSAGRVIKNIPSLKSFLSCGFRKIYENKDTCKVLLNYSELLKPEFIMDKSLLDVNQLAG
jgi:RimJ/RimL family protein N-acetyltransferase